MKFSNDLIASSSSSWPDIRNRPVSNTTARISISNSAFLTDCLHCANSKSAQQMPVYLTLGFPNLRSNLHCLLMVQLIKLCFTIFFYQIREGRSFEPLHDCWRISHPKIIRKYSYSGLLHGLMDFMASKFVVMFSFKFFLIFETWTCLLRCLDTDKSILNICFLFLFLC